MTRVAPQPPPTEVSVVVILKSLLKGTRFVRVPQGVASLPVHSLAEAASIPADALLIDADDTNSLDQLSCDGLSTGRLPPVLALAGSRTSGVEAIKRGAIDWTRHREGDGLLDRLEALQARSLREARHGGEGEPIAQCEELLRGQEASLRALGLLLECRDLETKGHTDRVVALADRLASHLDLAAEDRRALRLGAYLHDVGKAALPDRVLFKAGPLDISERELVREHSDIGYRLAVRLPFLSEKSRNLVLHHHERWDGYGYPHGLAGNEIPLLARVFGLVDVFDALLSRRVYKPAWTREKALAAVRREAGRGFDPEITAGFLDLMEAPARAVA